MARSLRLSTRLILLGVSGPLLGLAIFLIMASATSLGLARQARSELVNMFDQENKSTLYVATTAVQESTIQANKQLLKDSIKLKQQLAPLSIDAAGTIHWQQRSLPTDQARRELMQRMSASLSLPRERASLYHRNARGQWKRLAGITTEGQALEANWVVPTAEASFLTSVLEGDRLRNQSHGTVVLRDGGWWLSMVTPLEAGAQEPTTVLAVGTPTDVATRILGAVTSLFPANASLLAFYGISPSGDSFCNYETPGTGACLRLKQALIRSGGLPKPDISAQAEMIERQVHLDPNPRKGTPLEHLFIATFPRWNWFVVIAVDQQVLDETLGPLQKASRSALLQLTLITLLLIAGCAMAAIKISNGIKDQLRQLAGAANSIAAGETRQALAYDSDDALGRLVEAFNRMAGAVADREKDLKAQIKTLEISINNQDVSGQVGSIVNDPGFAHLSERARAMRDRRQNQRRADELQP